MYSVPDHIPQYIYVNPFMGGDYTLLLTRILFQERDFLKSTTVGDMSLQQLLTSNLQIF